MLKEPLPLVIPSDATKFILFQRTQYLFFRRNRLMQWLARSLPQRIALPLETICTKFNWSVSLEALLCRKRIAELFSEEMFAEYQQLERFLPPKAKALLDIGCGIGGIDAVLHAHYAPDGVNLYLIDKTEMPSKVYYGLREKGCFYNSFASVEKFLTGNGVPKEHICTQEATEGNTIDFNATFNVVLSLISWGFHYPVATYLDKVYEKLAPGGVLIMDVRKSFGGLEELQRKFGKYEVISDAVKHARVVVRKP